MISERQVHSDLRELLLNKEPFKYAHLIKFERPSRPDSATGKVSTSAERYTYLTDASRDVNFDDNSVDLNGMRNGTQVYIANKVLSVGNVQESVEAKADTCTIQLDGNGIGGSASVAINISQVNASTWDLEIVDKSVSLVNQGFREGDKITLSGECTGSFNIKNFRANNTIRVTRIDDDLDPGTDKDVTVVLDSEEIKSILLNKNDEDYSSFINREVYIYRAYFKDGIMVGELPDSEGNLGPILLFRGIITNVGFDDDDAGIKVQWGLTSHWGDFSQVKGRVTSDEFHRALDANGVPQPDSAIKPIYAYDKGFAHSDTSINLLSTYSVLVEKTTVRAKNGFFGIGAKTKVKTTLEPEDRNTALDFQLQAKSIPVIYGVRNTTGIPIFADTLKTSSANVFVVYALSEGQIGGIYDVYVEGKSLICNDEADYNVRSSQNSEGTIDLVCRGRADRGDVLGGVPNTDPNTAPIDYYYDPENGIDLRNVWGLDFNKNALRNYQGYVPPEDATVTNSGRGVVHGESITLTQPQEVNLDFFSGTESQKAASQLVQLAQSKQFKVQNDYWLGNDSAEYWGPNHRLIDTAYIVGRFTIKEGETTIPDLEFILRGKALECYNYDYSYCHDEKMSGENPNNFELGDTVTLSTGQIVQIIDKWSFYNPEGNLDTRFRFSEDPNLGYNEDAVASLKRFSMTKAGGATWTMVTYDWVIHEGTVGTEISAPVTDVTNPGGGIDITFPPNPNIPIGGGPGSGSPIYSIIDNNGQVRKDALISGNAYEMRVTSEVY